MAISIQKPWGREIIFTQPDLPYTGKIIYLNAGLKLSLQSHDTKLETITLYSGNALLASGSDTNDLNTTTMVPLEGYTIPPHTIHRIKATTDSVLIEISTPETGTTRRLEDDYNRPDETEEVRSSPNRGWSPQV